MVENIKKISAGSRAFSVGVLLFVVVSLGLIGFFTIQGANISASTPTDSEQKTITVALSNHSNDSAVMADFKNLLLSVGQKNTAYFCQESKITLKNVPQCLTDQQVLDSYRGQIVKAIIDYYNQYGSEIAYGTYDTISNVKVTTSVNGILPLETYEQFKLKVNECKNTPVAAPVNSSFRSTCVRQLSRSIIAEAISLKCK